MKADATDRKDSWHMLAFFVNSGETYHKDCKYQNDATLNNGCYFLSALYMFLSKMKKKET